MALLKQEVLIYAFGVTNSVDTVTLARCVLQIFSFASGNYLMIVYVTVGLVLMTLSNFFLFHYPRSHMKKAMQKTASQLRAANAAAFQEVISIAYCVFYFFNALSSMLSSSLVIGIRLSLTCSTPYVFWLHRQPGHRPDFIQAEGCLRLEGPDCALRCWRTSK